MAHNWTTKTIADYPTPANKFTVVTGDDTLGDGTPDNPYRSIPQGSLALSGTGNTLVAGTGGYTGNIVLNQVSLSGEYLKGKQTIINLDGGNLTLTSFYTYNIKDVTIKNGSIVSYYFTNYTRCTFIDCNFVFADGGILTNFDGCDFINCEVGTGLPAYFNATLCKFFNSTVFSLKVLDPNRGCRKLESCYVDSFSRIQFVQEASITEINFNDIEGQLMFQDGTNPDVYIGLVQALVEHPTKVGTNNINANPLFADVSKMAFTVSNSSPLLGASKTSGNIGNVKRGDVYFCDIDPELTDVSLGGNAEIINLDGTTDKTVNIAFPDGTFRTGVITVDSSNVSILGAIGYIGKYALDSSLGGTNNSQVPDSFDYADGTAGDNPDNLTFQMRWATGSTPPTTTTGWDNGGIRPADAYSTFVWNIQPRMDGSFLGNGDPAFNSGSSFVLGVKWIQIFGKIVKETWNGV